MKRILLLLSCAASVAFTACSSDKKAETPMEKAADLAPGTTIKGADGSKIKKQADGDLKVKDAQGNVVKKEADDGTIKAKSAE